MNAYNEMPDHIEEMLLMSEEEYIDSQLSLHNNTPENEQAINLTGNQIHEMFIDIIYRSTCVSQTHMKCLAKAFDVRGSIDQIKLELERLVDDIDAVDKYPEFIRLLGHEIDSNLDGVESIDLDLAIDPVSKSAHDRKECDCYL
jgi:hypothetical protein